MSSRRHAMLFHHSNGSCYVVDCGSAYGTYVNGKRIPSPSNGGLVIPQRVKRGSLIRFGGDGAPCFLLKSLGEEESRREHDVSSEDLAELVRRNTRLNAMGKYDQHHTYQHNSRETVHSTIEQALYVSRKRSFDSLDDSLSSFSSTNTGTATAVSVDEDDEPCPKRARCSSPPLVEVPPLRLVSPELSCSVKSRVSFSTKPPQAFYIPREVKEEKSSN